MNLNPDGSFSYTPNAGFSGVDSFIYVANDGELNSDVATVTIDVGEPLPPPPPNTRPEADNDNYTTDFESPIVIDPLSGVLNNDSDGDGDAITAILVNSPANGSVNLNPDGSFSYTPNAGFSGVDSFIYVANDGELNSDVATVTIGVEPPQPPTPNTPPIADNDNYTTSFESAITVDAISGILNGDSDANGEAISAILVNSPANGSVNLNPDGSFSYTPNAGFSGVDSFIYVANDGELNSDVATVTIAVDVPPPVEPNTPPIADNDNYTTDFESPIVIDPLSGVLNNDSDGDGDAITAILVNSPANGSVNLNPDGSFSYTPNAGFSGVDSFIYVANDGELNSDVATVTIDVEPPPEPPTPTPPVADNDNYTTGFQSPITVDASVGVLNGDSDGDGDPISAILVNSPANGSLNYFNADGSFSYTPNSGFSGVDSFTYTANDGKSDSNVATVTIDVGEPQPVEQTRTLNGYSQRSVDDTFIYSTFLLTEDGNNGQTIFDRTIDANKNGIIDANEIDSNPNLGFFPKAIQNFIYYDGLRVANTGDPINFGGETALKSEVNLSFDEEGKPIFTGGENPPEFGYPEFEYIPVLDLRATRVISPDDIIAELELTDELNINDEGIVVRVDNGSNEEIESFPEEIIIYEFLKEEDDGTRTIIEELILIEGQQRLELDNQDFLERSDYADLATNSLKDIIEEGLLIATYRKSENVNYMISILSEPFGGDRVSSEEPIEETILVQPDIF